MGDHLTPGADQVLEVVMSYLPWVIAALISATFFLISLSIFRVILLRSLKPAGDKKRDSGSDWTERAAPFLEMIPLPAGVESRWGREEIRQLLLHAGVTWLPQTFAAFRWLCLWIGIALAVVFWLSGQSNLINQFLALVCLFASYFGPPLWLSGLRDRRSESINLSLPEFLDRIALSMEAGLGFEVALRRTTDHFPGLLGDELRRLVRSLDRGHTRAEALEQMVRRNHSSDLAAFVAAVKQSDRLGTSLAGTLRVQTQILRARRRRRAEEAGRRLPILIVFPLVFFFLPALLIIYLAPPLLHLFLGR
jgi:pilus assembly protein TadC